MLAFRRITWCALGALALASTACGSDTAEPSAGTGAVVVPCNALELPPQAIELAEIVGAGHDSAGILYVVDRAPEHGLRLFVSEASALLRQPVSGTGEGNDALGAFVAVSAPELDLRVKVSVAAAGGMRMGVVHGEPDLRDFVIGQQGEELVLVTEEAVRAMPVQNLANGVIIEYFAALEDGRTLLVTRPERDFGYEDFRLFFGAGGRLIERKVSRVERQRDGGTTEISFELEGAAALAYFPAPMRNEPSRLSVGGSEWALAPIDGGLPETLELMCLG
jgi:hypothetical protein